MIRKAAFILLVLFPTVSQAQVNRILSVGEQKCTLFGCTQTGFHGSSICVGKTKSGDWVFLTAAHNVREAVSSFVYDGLRLIPAQVIASNIRDDMALLVVSTGNFTPIQFADSVAPNQRVWHTGTPPAVHRSQYTTAGFTSQDVRWRRMSRKMSGGDSGGAVTNRSGQLVGMTTSYSAMDTYGPSIDTIKSFLKPYLSVNEVDQIIAVPKPAIPKPTAEVPEEFARRLTTIEENVAKIQNLLEALMNQTVKIPLEFIEQIDKLTNRQTKMNVQFIEIQNLLIAMKNKNPELSAEVTKTLAELSGQLVGLTDRISKMNQQFESFKLLISKIETKPSISKPKSGVTKFTVEPKVKPKPYRRK